MPATPTTAYGETAGLRLLERLADEGRFVFTTDEARAVARKLDIPEPYLRVLLSRLNDGRWITRLRRGLYAGTGRLPGRSDIHPFVIATRLVTPSAISHWSAMQHHGLTEQVPQGVTAITTVKVVTPSMRAGHAGPGESKHAWEIAGTRYEYVNVSPEHFFGIEEVWVDELFSVPIVDRERAMLECFASPRAFGGMGEVLGILEEHLAELDLEKLVRYAVRYRKGAPAKRLGWSLERLGVGEEATAPLRGVTVRGYRLLDPTLPARGKRYGRWMIQNNLSPA